MSFWIIACSKLLKSSILMSKAPRPPITLSR